MVRSSVEAFAQGFEARHIGEVNNPNGTINMKIHNVFIKVLGEELQYYTALIRSFDSSLGNMLEKMAINIARLFFDVKQEVDGYLYKKQTDLIAEILEAYKNSNNSLTPSLEDYKRIKNIAKKGERHYKVHISDYYLIDKKLIITI